MTRVSKAEFARIKAAARRARREAKKADTEALMDALGASVESDGTPRIPPPPIRTPVRRRKIRRLSSRGVLKSQIIRLLGLLDRKKNGPLCRMIPECPVKEPHEGTLAYHVVPAQRGDSTRFLPENIVWACAPANYGEVRNRSLYRDKHVNRFGKEYVERIEAMAREARKYSRTELTELRAKLRLELEAS